MHMHKYINKSYVQRYREDCLIVPLINPVSLSMGVCIPGHLCVTVTALMTTQYIEMYKIKFQHSTLLSSVYSVDISD